MTRFEPGMELTTENLNEMVDAIVTLQGQVEALLASHRKLAMMVMGDTPECATFIGEIAAMVVDNRPQAHM